MSHEYDGVSNLNEIAGAACRRVSPSSPLAVAEGIEEAFRLVERFSNYASVRSDRQLARDAKVLLTRIGKGVT